MPYKTIELNVTQEIINAAIPRDSGHCMFADAVRAALPFATGVSVDLQTIRYSDPATRKRYVYLTPGVAQSMLVAFDQGEREKIRPTRLRLSRPAQIVHMRPSRSRANRHDEPAHPRTRTIAPAEPNGAAPVVIGGDYPPTAALSSTRGRRRTFGLRSLRP